MKRPRWVLGTVTATAGVCVVLVMIFAAPAWAPPPMAPSGAETAAAPPPADNEALAGVPPGTNGNDGFDLLGETPVLGGGYVGSAKCAECHNKPDTAIYDRFRKFSRKSQAYQSVKRMKGLSPKEREGCYRCHTTGYGKPTGFVSPEKTPHLADVGCEACHGPGKLHTQSMDMAHIVRKVTIDVCEKCHKDAKVKSFRYKGVIYAGAH